MAGTLRPTTVSAKQQRIAELAKQMPNAALTSLSHHIDLDWMREAFRVTRKDGAPGIDGQTGVDYERELESNLTSLLDRAKKGDPYRAPPVRRVFIPKANGEQRPIGIPTFEDKVLQRAVMMAIEPVYEQDFLDCSFGFRPNRSAHQALDRLRDEIMAMGGGWVLEIDIQSFYDSVDHRHMQEILRLRIRDGVILRLIGKWLNAGVLEEGRLERPDAGTPQGGVISPLLANVYLHVVLDVWFEQDVVPRLAGRAAMVRYADDAVFVFSDRSDAERVLAVLHKRFERYGLTLHPEKTKLVPFRRPPRDPPRDDRGPPKPGTFNFLGFTHYWGRSRRGKRVVKVKTAKDRMARAFRKINEWLGRVRHWAVRDQHAALCRKLRGHDAYYGVTFNARSLQRLRHWIERAWLRWLRRRSQRHRLTWERMRRLLERYPLPRARIVHSHVGSETKA